MEGLMAADPAENAAAEAEKPDRERSTIEFPYMDLDDAVQVAQAIQNSTGASTCKPDMLATRLELSMNSSGFRSRISTAKMFGLIETDRSADGYRLTTLGLHIVDPATRQRAMVEAFMTVPLYKRVYEAMRGRQIPPAAAFERELASMGVVAKQTDRARQTLERSAATAGFFEAGRDRLIMPHVPGDPPPKPENQSGGGGGSSGGGGRDDLDVVIRALIQKLPADGKFDINARVRWLRQIEMAFQDAYEPEQGEIEIKPKSSQKEAT
jgi:hypothetical protein